MRIDVRACWLAGAFLCSSIAHGGLNSWTTSGPGGGWTTVVAAELNNGIPGIGGLAYLSGTQLDTPLTIASIIVIGLAAVALDGLIKLLETALVPWRGKA